MSHVLADDNWVPKSNGGSVGTPSSLKFKSFSLPVSIPSSLNVSICLIEIVLKLESIEDLLLSSHFYIYKIKDVSKKTSTNVARLKVRLDQVIKKVTKVFAKI
ncbi:hypothetical protein FXO37_35123 [Capsicum annuum]|nr:hypothetical protein FXO37_35123 [Capsicum annuum]